MSDQEHNDNIDPIERLFREKADEYDIEYNENDWLSLEERLDKADLQRKRRRRRRWLAAAVILAFALLTYITIDNQMQINRLNEKLSQYESAEQESPSQVQQQDKQGQQKSPSSGTDRESPDKPSDIKQSVEQQATSNLAAADDTTSTSKDPKAEKTTPERQDQDLNNQTNRSPIPLQSFAAADISASGELQTTDLAGLRTTKAGNVRPGASPATGIPHKTDTKAIAAAADTPRRQSPSRFALGLVLGPDLSTTGSLSNFYEPGHEYGVTVEYNLGKNLGIATGLIRSRVLYSSRGSEYNPRTGYWSNNPVPREIIGDCVLLDIPVRLKYNFLNLGNSRFYATAGISSYIMLNEDYQYDYGSGGSYGTQSNRPRGWSGKTRTKHWMSNANISVGYEYDILRSWSLRAEPYLKVPIKEVGWGNVELYSMGMTVSINYKL